jgi:hypothetical protein
MPSRFHRRLLRRIDFSEERFIIARTAEITEDGCESNRSKGIDGGQFVEDLTPDMIARDLTLTRFGERPFYAVNESLDRFRRNRALHTSVLDAGKKLPAIVFLAPLIMFNDTRQRFLDTFAGRKTPAALIAFATSANFGPVPR